jgi:hypothetical protein
MSQDYEDMERVPEAGTDAEPAEPAQADVDAESSEAERPNSVVSHELGDDADET